jgi:AraC-like DNA-binding protein
LIIYRILSSTNYLRREGVPLDINIRTIEINGLQTLGLSEHVILPRSNYSVQHCYHTLRICLILKGKGEWVIGGKTYDIEKDDIFILNNVETRTIRTVFPPEPLIMKVIYFEPRFIWTYSDNIFDSSYLKIFFGRNENFENRLNRSNPAAAKIKNIMLDTIKEFDEKQSEYEQMIKVNLLQILVNINRHFNYTKSNSAALQKDSILYISRVMDFIDNNISEEITLNTLADIAHMNPSYFSTVFKKYNGITLSQYILRKRINMAIDYLMNSKYTILEIACLCGFNTTANFYKAFKGITGKVPTDYRVKS